MRKTTSSIFGAAVGLAVTALSFYLHPLRTEYAELSNKIYAAVTPEAKLLVPTHPRMQKVCDLAGGCGNVDIECRRYDNTGDSDLRGDVWVTITTHLGYHRSGDGWYHAEGTGYDVHGLFSSQSPQRVATVHEAYQLAIEAAIDEWLHEYYAPGDVDNTVYPHATSCDKSCK